MPKRLWIRIIFLEIILILFFSPGEAGNNFLSPLTGQEALAANQAAPELKIAFLDIGQGDAAFFIFPNGEQMLVDCGKDAGVLAALGRVMSFNDRTIDYLAITHPDSDHYGGCVDVMKRFQIKNIIYNGLVKKQDDFWFYFFSTIEDLKSKGTSYLEINRPTELTVGGARFNFLYPDHAISESPFVPGTTKENDNNTSLVFTVEYGGKKVLMTGDMEIELEKYLLAKYPAQLPADILKVGHHGSDTSSGKSFVEKVRPSYAVISAGKNNPFGHPSRRTLRKLERLNAKILRTDEKSDILFAVASSTLITN